MAAGDTARRATAADAARIADIYNQGIQDRIATFETDSRSADDIAAWFQRQYPVVVVEREGEVVAWASASEYRPRHCYARNAEFSVYVDRAARGTGAGMTAMNELLRTARIDGFHKLISRVFVENTASRALLTRLGFREVGIYHQHGKLDDVWRDVVIVERILTRNDDWIALHAGQQVTVTKAHWGNHRAPVSYQATVIPCDRHDWIAVEASWTLPNTTVAGLCFDTGGRLVEFFSPTRPYNVFRVYGPDVNYRGLYANVTAPVAIEQNEEGRMTITWEDRWLDVVKLPAGPAIIVDEEEYLATGIARSHPDLDREIRAALASLLSDLQDPFWEG